MINLSDKPNQVRPLRKFPRKDGEPKYGAMNISGNHTHSHKKNRMYIISEYHADDKGTFRPELPDSGPCHAWDDCPCKIINNYFRHRKTGVLFPLLVVKCEIHNKGFTIYPPGHFPYGRQPLAPVAPDGDLMVEKKGVERFEGTFFDAALDAARGHAWPCASEEGSLTSRLSTQNRHLSSIALMLGIQPGLHKGLREDIARVLALPGQLLHDSTANIRDFTDAQSKGRAICCILNAIEESTLIFERLAEAGAKVCLWPPPMRWDARLKIFRSSPLLSNTT